MATSLIAPKVAPGRELVELENGIWTAIPNESEGAPYDTRAAAYDFVVGSPLYNLLMWGTSIDSYEAFAHEAFTEDNQPFLDAGCGTMKFTAHVYAGVEQPVTAVDRSLGMLRRAKDRITAERPDAGSRLALIQADLMDMPFAEQAFETILCMGMAHLFSDLGRLVDRLFHVLQPGGELYLTSLVANNRPIGDRYGRFLLDRGELGAWRTPEEVISVLSQRLDVVKWWTEGNMLFAWAVRRL